MLTLDSFTKALIVGLLSILATPEAVGAPKKPAVVAAPSPDQAALKEADDLVMQAGEKLRQKKFDEAVSLAEKALAIREKHKPNSASVEVVLRLIADIHEKAGNHARGVPPMERALALCIKRDVKGFELQMCHQYVGYAYARAGQHERAVQAFERATTIARELDRGTDGEHASMSLWSMAKSFTALRRYADAEAAISRVIKYFESEPGQRGIEGPLFLLGELYHEQGLYTRAEPILSRALELKARRFTRGHATDIMNKLAFTRMALEDYEGARVLLDEMLQDAKASGEDSLRFAIVLATRGGLDVKTGAYDRAEPLLDRAQAIADKLVAKPDEGAIVVAVAIAGVRGRLALQKGDFVRAEKLLVQELEVVEKKFGPKDKTVADAASELADLHRRVGRFDRADVFAMRALSIRDEVLAPTHPSRAESRAILGRIREARADALGAKKLHEEALAMREQAFGPEHPHVGSSLQDLADLARRQGQFAQAEGYYKRAVAIFEKAFGPDHDQVAAALEGLSALHAGAGKVELAVRLAERAADIRERQAALIVAGGSDAQKRAFVETIRVGTDFVTSLHAQVAPSDDRAKRLSLTTIFQRKGRVLDVMAGSLSVLRKRLSPADLMLFDEVAVARAEVSRLAMRGPAGAPLDTFRAELAKREEKARALEEKLGGQSDVFRAEQIPVTIERVQALVPEGMAIIELSEYVPRRAAERQQSSRLGAPRIAAYVLDGSGKIGFVDLGESAPIEQAVQTLRKVLSSPSGEDPKKPARELDELVMRKVRPLLGRKTKLLISADGALSLVPFAALVDDDGQYMVGKYEITYLTSGRDLLRLARQTLVRNAPVDKMLVVANPAFGSRARGESALGLLDEGSPDETSDGKARGMEKAFFVPLPATAVEARRLSALIPEATVLVDVEATETAVKKARAPRMLHIATHGFFVSNKALAARTAAAEQRGLELDVVSDWLPDDPLLRSGIALAGANSKTGGGGEDGILTALEASSLDLQGTKLVVLSACETGVGDVMQGEGIYGLRRALFVAGAESLVASLWQVADEETQSLMVAYYGRLLKGETRSGALRNVQISMLGAPATSHPYYWASFGMFGNSSAMGTAGDAAPEPSSEVSRPGQTRPSARGCACIVTGDARDQDGYWKAVALGLVLAYWRRERRTSSLA